MDLKSMKSHAENGLFQKSFCDGFWNSPFILAQSFFSFLTYARRIEKPF